MVFSSELFIYGFMPVFFSLYYLIADQRKNWLILAASLIFYSVGAGSTVLVLLVSIWINQFLAIRIEPAPLSRRRALLTLGIAVNLLGLGYYKYGTFIWQLSENLADAIGFVRLPAAASIPLPIGISFFTFQAISYLMDIYRKEISAAGTYSEFATYHSLFPQLVAGPIVRYREIKLEMRQRVIDLTALTEGSYRFCLGLGKKIVIADNVGIVVDGTFALPLAQLDAGHAWLGIFCYSLQIYFDFSGYSDMAIGLGRLLGFHFPENFDQPYRSASITEFWRRWHLTLSRWFRDYVYIPLGGNRRGVLRTSINLWLVFFLCGLWHGAGLTFIGWGLYHGLMLSLERLARSRFDWKPSGWGAIVMTFILVTIGWVFFRASTVGAALDYLGAMFFISKGAAILPSPFALLPSQTLFYLAIALLFAFAPFERLSRLRLDGPVLMVPQLGFSIICLAYSSLLLAANSFNPFIYFRF
jgi:alginate O-acetyltransferase complex protein AlgI